MTSEGSPRPDDSRLGDETEPADLTTPSGETPAEAADPEEFAEAAGIDPTPQEVDEYLKLAEERPPWSGPPEP